jgi:hypothetical protein
MATLSPPLTAWAADELGRLFFTPEQRALLDLARRTQATGAQTGSAAAEGLTLNGIVTRSDGGRVVWVNGQAQLLPAARESSPAAATLPLPGGGRVRLRVGQSLDAQAGRVAEGWQRPPPPAAPAAAPAQRRRGTEEEHEAQ